MATVQQPARTAAVPAEIATGSSAQTAPRTWIERNHFWLRRLHSLTGIVPIGGFIIYHFWENATALLNPAAYDEMAGHARNLQLLIFIEIGLIFLPLLYHALYGLFIASYSRYNTTNYSYTRNRLFMWQRISGIILVLFITYHVLVLRFGAFADRPATFADMVGHLRNPFIFAFYVAGILSVSYHLGNGLWAFLITWGVTVGKRAQRISQWVSTAVAVALGLVGVSIITAIALSSVQ